MLCYFISKKDFSLLNCVEVNSYSVEHNLDLGGKSKIVIACNPKAAADDFVVLKDGKDIKLKGIIEKIDNVQGESMHTISCLEIERVFDRKIFLTDAEIIRKSAGYIILFFIIWCSPKKVFYIIAQKRTPESVFGCLICKF